MLKFKKDLETMVKRTIFTCNDVNDAYNNFVENYTKKFDSCFPLIKQSKKKKEKKSPWYDSDF